MIAVIGDSFVVHDMKGINFGGSISETWTKRSNFTMLEVLDIIRNNSIIRKRTSTAHLYHMN
jgi:hypothetical protein